MKKRYPAHSENSFLLVQTVSNQLLLEKRLIDYINFPLKYLNLHE